MNLWKKYKNVLHKTFPLHNGVGSVWANWESKGTNLLAKTYTAPYIIKSREVEIWNEKTCIYNNILYPKTGHNLPCFGMDLMGFNENRVIRFFEPGNHFSENIYVVKCNMEEVNDHLDMFTEYLTKFKDMLELKKPTGKDTSLYKDFDSYMTKLDPVGGYLTGKFGKENAESLVNDFLFTYG